jgi:hypothetical protein
MLRMEAHSKLPAERVGEKLKSFFGDGGLGLELIEDSPGCLTFQGGGGYVTATLCTEGHKTRIDLVTQEWDYDVKKFVSELS